MDSHAQKYIKREAEINEISVQIQKKNSVLEKKMQEAEEDKRRMQQQLDQHAAIQMYVLPLSPSFSSPFPSFFSSPSPFFLPLSLLLLVLLLLLPPFLSLLPFLPVPLLLNFYYFKIPFFFSINFNSSTVRMNNLRKWWLSYLQILKIILLARTYER